MQGIRLGTPLEFTKTTPDSGLSSARKKILWGIMESYIAICQRTLRQDLLSSNRKALAAPWMLVTSILSRPIQLLCIQSPVPCTYPLNTSGIPGRHWIAPPASIPITSLPASIKRSIGWIHPKISGCYLGQ